MKKSAKESTMSHSVATKTRSVHSLGLPSAAEVPRIGKTVKALSLNVAQRLTPVEFPENRVASCDRHLANVAQNITSHDRAFLEKSVHEPKVRMIRALRVRTPESVTLDTLRPMARLSPTKPDALAVSIAVVITAPATATSIATQSGNACTATSSSVPASMSVSRRSSIVTPAPVELNAMALSLPTSAMV